MNIQHAIHIFGEVLFDHFPEGSRVLGGAPFNVAWHLQAFGLAPNFISRIGDDPSGEEISALMADWGMCRKGIQIDNEHPTGSVNVTLQKGEPCYEIVPDSAYDFIDSDLLHPEASHGILYHGSLALRNLNSLNALQTVKIKHRGKIFMDVNLRSPWWDEQMLSELLSDAHWVKLNQVELAILSPNQPDLASAMRHFYSQFNLETLVVTCGEQGVFALDEHQQFVNIQPSRQVPVVDTVGAGDAFAAILLLGLTQNWPLEVSLEKAQTFASAIVGCRGATVTERAFYQNFSEQWGLVR